ncbi:MAG TPA: hypothetical protein ENH62_05080 [Marinobacter sp.]|uniref:Uncharacterized protein n=1 Tax=marine sediment metagenome TaxID=412755 RepID=A0A0F9KGV3_9ZZZZ|nr:hypothetical protein [Marinobacter sp.]
MAESMTERVARAISNAAYDDKAKAAIGAMREPTEEMLLASWHQTASVSSERRMAVELGTPRSAHLAKMKQRWQAMIDKALEDG